MSSTTFIKKQICVSSSTFSLFIPLVVALFLLSQCGSSQKECGKSVEDCPLPIENIAIVNPTTFTKFEGDIKQEKLLREVALNLGLSSSKKILRKLKNISINTSLGTDYKLAVAKENSNLLTYIKDYGDAEEKAFIRKRIEYQDQIHTHYKAIVRINEETCDCEIPEERLDEYLKYAKEVFEGKKENPNPTPITTPPTNDLPTPREENPIQSATTANTVTLQGTVSQENIKVMITNPTGLESAYLVYGGQKRQKITSNTNNSNFQVVVKFKEGYSEKDASLTLLVKDEERGIEKRIPVLRGKYVINLPEELE